MKIELEKISNNDYDVYVDDNKLLLLKNIGMACPEQYELRDLLLNKEIGYFRVRWSYFTANLMPNFIQIYSKALQDNSGWAGSFGSEEERVECLSNGIEMIIERLREVGEEYEE